MAHSADCSTVAPMTFNRTGMSARILTPVSADVYDASALQAGMNWIYSAFRGQGMERARQQDE